MNKLKKIVLIINGILNIVALILCVCSFFTGANLWILAIICVALGFLINYISDIYP